MYKVLGRKNEHRENENDLWVEVYRDCVNHISKEETDELANRTIRRLKEMSIGHSRLGYAWSGGKDSIAMLDLIRKSGILIFGGVFVQYENEYPEFLEWVERNKPADLSIVKANAFTLEYIKKHPNLLFPIDSKSKSAYIPPRWKAQNKWCSENGIDGLITGRRTIDGNICGKGFITRSGGVDKINFMADWSQEQLLAYIRWNGLELPPTYWYPNGFVYGTHCWTERNRVNGSVEETFEELSLIDKRILLEKEKLK